MAQSTQVAVLSNGRRGLYIDLKAKLRRFPLTLRVSSMQRTLCGERLRGLMESVLEESHHDEDAEVC